MTQPFRTEHFWACLPFSPEQRLSLRGQIVPSVTRAPPRWSPVVGHDPRGASGGYPLQTRPPTPSAARPSPGAGQTPSVRPAVRPRSVGDVTTHRRMDTSLSTGGGRGGSPLLSAAVIDSPASITGRLGGQRRARAPRRVRRHLGGRRPQRHSQRNATDE